MVKTKLRTEENYARYKKNRKPLEELPSINEWTHWRLVKNEFPYDTVFDKHDLLILNRKVESIFDLTKEEKDELEFIVDGRQSYYDGILYPFRHSMTYPDTLHLHLFHTLAEKDNDS